MTPVKLRRKRILMSHKATYLWLRGLLAFSLGLSLLMGFMTNKSWRHSCCSNPLSSNSIPQLERDRNASARDLAFQPSPRTALEDFPHHHVKQGMGIVDLAEQKRLNEFAAKAAETFVSAYYSATDAPHRNQVRESSLALSMSHASSAHSQSVSA